MKKPRHYIDPVRAIIERKKSAVKGVYLHVCNREESRIFQLPGTLTYRQAREVLNLVNKAYRAGFDDGEAHAITDVFHHIKGE